jgi:hypothetical protein
MNEATISDIRLGWLQRFCAIAQHESIARAARACSIDPTALSDSVQRLEEALHILLIAPATAHITARGRHFLPSAERVLELSHLSPRTSANVCVGWLQALIAAVENESYVKAAEVDWRPPNLFEWKPQANSYRRKKSSSFSRNCNDS